MTEAGIPWTRDAVVNLETGRRKRLAIHEVLALAYVLDVANPVDLLVPETGRYFPILPGQRLYRATVREWFEGKTGPLRQRQKWGPEEIAAAAEEIAAGLPRRQGSRPRPWKRC